MPTSDDLPTAAGGPIGFVGLGAIGGPMVTNLLAAGVPVVVNDLDEAVVAGAVAAGAVSAPTLPGLADAVRVVAVCVPADAHVRAVLDGPDGLLAHLAAGSTVAVLSTVLPETVLWAAEAAADRGVGVVEAAVTGGFMAAAEGRSTFLLGGDPATFGPLEPLLAACGDVRIHAGGLGSASRLKLCVNLQTYATFLGVSEAATLAKSLGLELDALMAAMQANGQLNEFVANYLILHQLPAADLADPAMQQTLAGYAAIIEKDLDLIGRLADSVGVDVAVARTAAAEARRVYFLEEERP